MLPTKPPLIEIDLQPLLLTETDLIPQLPSLPEITITKDQIDDNLPELSQPAITFSADVTLPGAVSERRLAIKRKF